MNHHTKGIGQKIGLYEITNNLKQRTLGLPDSGIRRANVATPKKDELWEVNKVAAIKRDFPELCAVQLINLTAKDLVGWREIGREHHQGTASTQDVSENASLVRLIQGFDKRGERVTRSAQGSATISKLLVGGALSPLCLSGVRFVPFGEMRSWGRFSA